MSPGGGGVEVEQGKGWRAEDPQDRADHIEFNLDENEAVRDRLYNLYNGLWCIKVLDHAVFTTQLSKSF